MFATEELTVTDTVVESLPPCEGRQHTRGIIGHVPDEAAAFTVVNPCGEKASLCNSRVTYMFFVSFDIGCKTCGKSHPISDYLIQPL